MPEGPVEAGHPPPFLSLVVMTRNEESNIPAMLDNLRGVDEIVVADMESEDLTVEFALARGARVLALPNAGFAEPGRMDAIRFAKGSWVLMLDADERLPEGGVAAVRALCEETPPAISAYRIPRINYLGNVAIRGSGWGPESERHARLFRRDRVDWAPRVHTSPQFHGGVLDLPDDGVIRIEHANFRDYSHLLEKLNDYSSIEAREMLEDHRQPTLALAVRFALEELVGRYDPERDGPLSLALALAMFGYRFSCHAKAVEARGWTDEPVISRNALVAGAGAFWAELRRCELVRAGAALRHEGNDSVQTAERALAVWGDMPHQLGGAGVTTEDGNNYELPLRRLDGDYRSAEVHQALQELRVRVELREERRKLRAAEARAEEAESERDEALAKLSSMASALRDGLARATMLENIAADSQAHEAAMLERLQAMERLRDEASLEADRVLGARAAGIVGRLRRARRAK